MSSPLPPGLDEEAPGSALAKALLAMAAVAVVVGLCIGLAMVVGVSMTGVGEGADDVTAGEEPSLYLPSYTPTEASEDDGWSLPDPADQPSALPTVGGATTGPDATSDEITLFMTPQAVTPGERININGVYADGEGVRLLIQRKENGVWTDFPVDAYVRGGAFDTWVQTSRTGRTKWRVYDAETDRASNVVTITIG